jgi:hypothetical protein
MRGFSWFSVVLHISSMVFLIYCLLPRNETLIESYDLLVAWEIVVAFVCVNCLRVLPYKPNTKNFSNMLWLLSQLICCMETWELWCFNISVFHTWLVQYIDFAVLGQTITWELCDLLVVWEIILIFVNLNYLRDLLESPNTRNFQHVVGTQWIDVLNGNLRA